MFFAYVGESKNHTFMFQQKSKNIKNNQQHSAKQTNKMITS